MSLISSIATIATAGAAGGETFWASSVRVTTSTVSGQAANAYALHGEHEGDGTIMQFFDTNADMPVEGRKQAFIIARNPVDGSIITQKKTNNEDEENKFSAYCGAAFYNPDADKVFVGCTAWFDPSGNGSNRNGYLPVDSDCTYGETIAHGDDRTTNGNGSYLRSYRGDKLITIEYIASTDTVPYPAGKERKTNNVGADNIWVERGSNDVFMSGSSNNENRLMKTSATLTSLSDLSYVKSIPPLLAQPLRNYFSNFEQCLDSSYLYGWVRANQPNPDEVQLYQIPRSNISTYKSLRWRPYNSFNGQAVYHRSYCSICVADGYIYFSSPILYRGIGEGFNSIMYAIHQIDPSTLQPVAAIGIRCNHGELQKADSNPCMITRNAEETCLYLSFSSITSNRGSDRHKLLKIPLDLSSIPAQNISGGSTHGTIQIWDFLSTSTGATLPVQSELFESVTNSTGNHYNRTVTDYENTQDSNVSQEANESTVTSSLLTDLDPITI